MAGSPDEEDEPFDPEEYPDPEGPPPPGEDELTAAEIAAIAEANDAEARAAAAAARTGTTGALAALAALAGRRGPGQPGSARVFPGESSSRAASFGSGLVLDVMPGCPDRGAGLRAVLARQRTFLLPSLFRVAHGKSSSVIQPCREVPFDPFVLQLFKQLSSRTIRPAQPRPGLALPPGADRPAGPAAGPLIAALMTPHDQQRETSLDKRRGHRPRLITSGVGRPPVLTLADRLLATILHQRLALPQTAIAALSGVRPETVNKRIRDIRQLMDQARYAIQPGPHRLASLKDLSNLAAAEGIPAPAEIKTAC